MSNLQNRIDNYIRRKAIEELGGNPSEEEIEKKIKEMVDKAVEEAKYSRTVDQDEWKVWLTKTKRVL